MKTMITRKIIALCSMLIFFTTASIAQQFTLPNVQGNPGQSITVSVNITEAIPNVGAITLFFQFDESALAYVNYAIVMPEAAGMLVNKYPGQPKVGMAWSANTGGVNFPTGTMLTVTFNVLSCNGSALTFLPSQSEIVDWDVNLINVTYVNGNVSNIPVGEAVWTGNGGNSSWGNPANWTGGVPTCGTNVTIPGGLNFYPTVSTPAFCNNITIESGATLITNAALNVSGESTVKRDYTGGEWHLISSPVSNATADMFLGLYLQNHNEGTNLYTDIIDPSTSLNVMQGYAIWNSATGTAEFMGPLNNGAIGTANNVTRTANGITRGWNLVGNPYPSAIDWDAATGWTKTNVGNATYRHVNAATWASYIGGVGLNGGTRYIAPGQGFFVSVTDGQTTGTLNMNNSVRTHAATPFFKDEVADIVRLEVSGNGYTDETAIRFLEDATIGFDENWDAHKLFGTVNEAPAVYCSENGMMSVSSLPETAAVPVGVKAGVPGVFTLTATETSEFPNVILEDLLTGVFTDLKNASYTFNYDMELDNRFIVHYTPMAIGEGIAEQIYIYSSQKDVYVNVPANTEGEIVIYNVMGQEIARSGINSTENKVTLNESAYYLVKVMSNENVVTKKVFVN